jgi:hypothetical protein
MLAQLNIPTRESPQRLIHKRLNAVYELANTKNYKRYPPLLNDLTRLSSSRRSPQDYAESFNGGTLRLLERYNQRLLELGDAVSPALLEMMLVQQSRVHDRYDPACRQLVMSGVAPEEVIPGLGIELFEYYTVHSNLPNIFFHDLAMVEGLYMSVLTDTAFMEDEFNEAINGFVLNKYHDYSSLAEEILRNIGEYLYSVDQHTDDLQVSFVSTMSDLINHYNQSVVMEALDKFQHHLDELNQILYSGLRMTVDDLHSNAMIKLSSRLKTLVENWQKLQPES